MSHSCSTLLGLLAAASLTVPAPAAQQPPIIDMHLHAHEPGPDLVPAGIPSICRPEPCEGWGKASATPEESLERTLAAMKRHNVVKAVLSGPLEIVRAWTKVAPDLFLPSPFILEPGKASADALRPEYEAGRLVAMGEIAAQLTGHAPNDPALAPYFALAEEREVPVLIHVLGIGPYTPAFRSANGDPLLLEEVLVKHPKLRIYLENSGYPYLDRMIAMMYQYPQLHGDLSTITWIIPRAEFHRYLRGLVTAGLGKRLMFGSDQMRWPESIGRAIEGIESADFLTADQKRDILHDNAARFLRLDGAAGSRAPSRAERRAH
jgi:predicted TIM-barrel fold metal-dependent hydrolase